MKIDFRIIYAVMFVVMVVPLLHPLGLPIKVQPYTKSLYDFIQNLPAGSLVLVSFDYSAGGMDEVYPQGLALITNMFQRPLKQVWIGLEADSPLMIGNMLGYLTPADYNGKKYGTDYVIFGFVPGLTSAAMAFGTDFAQ